MSEWVFADRHPRALLAWWVMAILVVLLLGFAHAAPALTEAQQAQAARIEQNLRCPVCSGESVYDSRATFSAQLRADVAQFVAQSLSDRDIYAYFQRRFGDSILMQPPVRGVNLWLWGLPVAVVVIGGVWLFVFLRSRRREPEPELSQEELARVDAELQARRDPQGPGPGQAELNRVDAERAARRDEKRVAE